MAVKGGVVSLSIAWHCNLDYDFVEYCKPKYNFRILDDFGWNFRHAQYHEENRRTLYKMYGIKVRRIKMTSMLALWIQIGVDASGSSSSTSGLLSQVLSFVKIPLR